MRSLAAASADEAPVGTRGAVIGVAGTVGGVVAFAGGAFAVVVGEDPFELHPTAAEESRRAANKIDNGGRMRIHLAILIPLVLPAVSSLVAPSLVAPSLAVSLATAGSGSSGSYDVLVGLHVVSAVVGFGAVAISGAYGAIGRRASRAGSPEDVSRFFASSNRGEYLLVVAPLFGLAAMGDRPGGAEYGQLWAVVGYVVWIAASALLLLVVRPAEARIRGRAAPPQPAGDTGDGITARHEETLLMWAAGACDLLFVAALMVMVVQPS